MSASNRRLSGPKKTSPSRAPLTLNEESRILREEIKRLEVSTAARPRFTKARDVEDESSAMDSWRRSPAPKRVPHNRRAQQSRELTTTVVQFMLSSVLLLGAVLFFWKRFGHML
jgi:hypothetical protein